MFFFDIVPLFEFCFYCLWQDQYHRPFSLLFFPYLCVLFIFFLFFFNFYFFISWRLITLQYCSGFCRTLKWLSHGFTCVPHPDPPSTRSLWVFPVHQFIFFHQSPVVFSFQTFHFLLKFIPKYYIDFDVFMNCIVFIFADILLLICTDFSLLILYLAIY